MNTLQRLDTPQLQLLHRGKVRDSFRVDPHTRLIVVTDRISAFDSVLDTPIPGKGEVLNRIANFWFRNTKDIVSNHVLGEVDPTITLVREARPIRVEMVVRGYITGSMWRGYQKGKRVFSGASVPDGLTYNARLPSPICTPTTKEDSDQEITPEGIIAAGLADEVLYRQMEKTALALYERGSKILGEKGLLLADTKYEFGLAEGDLVLIDEIHTPDSSRFWEAEDHARAPEKATQMDKEFVRQWLIANRHPVTQAYPTALPQDVIEETTRRYRELFHRVTGDRIQSDPDKDVRQRVYENLMGAGLLKPGYVAIIMGSSADMNHAQRLLELVRAYGAFAELRIVSAHKNGERIAEMALEYNNSIEPGAVIAIAGLSNGLGGALAANMNIPVISCPPFKDNTDLMLNVHSSLMMPSGTPAATVVRPDNAAQMALRSLNIRKLRERLSDDIASTKEKLESADLEVRGR